MVTEGKNDNNLMFSGRKWRSCGERHSSAEVGPVCQSEPEHGDIALQGEVHRLARLRHRHPHQKSVQRRQGMECPDKTGALMICECATKVSHVTTTASQHFLLQQNPD